MEATRVYVASIWDVNFSACICTLTLPNLPPSFLLFQAIFKLNFLPYNTPNFPNILRKPSIPSGSMASYNS